MSSVRKHQLHRFLTKDLTEKVIPALGANPITVQLVGAE